jgi:hypothetical protein
MLVVHVHAQVRRERVPDFLAATLVNSFAPEYKEQVARMVVEEPRLKDLVKEIFEDSDETYGPSAGPRRPGPPGRVLLGRAGPCPHA